MTTTVDDRTVLSTVMISLVTTDIVRKDPKNPQNDKVVGTISDPSLRFPEASTNELQEIAARLRLYPIVQQVVVHGQTLTLELTHATSNEVDLLTRILRRFGYNPVA